MVNGHGNSVEKYISLSSELGNDNQDDIWKSKEKKCSELTT